MRQSTFCWALLLFLLTAGAWGQGTAFPVVPNADPFITLHPVQGQTRSFVGVIGRRDHMVDIVAVKLVRTRSIDRRISQNASDDGSSLLESSRATR